MTKNYIIEWDAGYGNKYKEIEADNAEEAEKIAYEQWREDAESQARYGVIGEATSDGI